jgi:hypothetical protein
MHLLSPVNEAECCIELDVDLSQMSHFTVMVACLTSVKYCSNNDKVQLE